MSMTSAQTEPDFLIRAVQYRDMDIAQPLLVDACRSGWTSTLLAEPGSPQSLQHQPWQVQNLLPGPFQSAIKTLVATQSNRVQGVIQVAPTNRAQTTWKINALGALETQSFIDLGTELLRHCLQSIYEAHTWLAEIDVNRTDYLALYRSNGFQPLAHATHWSITSSQLTQLAQTDPQLPALISINNADAALLYQLDTVAMPPFVRQVLDRRVQDFTQPLLQGIWDRFQQTLTRRQILNGYLFEPQRKVAMGCFEICLSLDGAMPHIGQMTVHPAYTWLYPKLLSHMAVLTQSVPPAPLHLTSTDYQSEREEYLQQVQAERVGHSLMMSRSVWHKLRETHRHASETFPLAEVLQGLQPNHTPIPGRMKGQG